MGQSKSNRIFNGISPVYGLFYEKQKKKYGQIIEKARSFVDMKTYDTVLDVGCGTGALCSVLEDLGLEVTGVDAAERMVAEAKKRNPEGNIRFEIGDVLQGLPYGDKSFDLVFSSYVAHGLHQEQRKILYREMGRLARHMVIIHDYNKNRAPLTSFIEWLEGGDYFRFIQVAEEEMGNCLDALGKCFSQVRVLDVDKRASWYLCQVPDPLSGTQPSQAEKDL